VLDAFPRIYVHCGRPASALEADDAALRDDRDQQLAALDASLKRDRAALRFWLAAIGGAAFLATVVGGPLLIGRGLVPVRTLSDAVSRVNERDFRLPVEPAALSRELLPIHARLTATLDALRRAFEREKQSVADISHELRTPVAALLATLDVTLRKPRTADQYRAALEDSRGIGRQLAGLVERVMTLASLDAGNDRVAMTDADATLVAVDCAAVIRPLAVANGLTFDTDLTGPVPLVTDPDKLREVIVNLLHNAVEYNRPGGSIRLGVRSGADGGAVVEVTDTGIGMTRDIRERIFERFFRADPSRHAAGVHAGLGLSIVKEYIDRLGGTIAVESEPGAGSTFRVTLPGTGAPAAEPEPEPELVATGYTTAGHP
jgi:signal transduction histidine kinase